MLRFNPFIGRDGNFGSVIELFWLHCNIFKLLNNIFRLSTLQG